LFDLLEGVKRTTYKIRRDSDNREFVGTCSIGGNLLLTVDHVLDGID
jgi:hypothetical protein